jgi:hypothetical protein
MDNLGDGLFSYLIKRFVPSTSTEPSPDEPEPRPAYSVATVTLHTMRLISSAWSLGHNVVALTPYGKLVTLFRNTLEQLVMDKLRRSSKPWPVSNVN